MKHYISAIVIALFSICVNCSPLGAAETLEVADLFASHMVLQQKQEVPVWGWAPPGAQVTIAFAGQSQKAVADNEGNWRVKLTALEASKESRSMTIKAAGDTITLKDVLVGEVWLCSGQSNMVWQVDKLKVDIAAIKKAADLPLIRHCSVDTSPMPTPQKHCTASWKVCSPETVGNFSSTAYFFGMNLYKDLDIPIGLVVSAVGGTPIESWLPIDQQLENAQVMKAKAMMDKQAETYDEAKENQKYEKSRAKWEKSIKEVKPAEGKKRKSPSIKAHPQKSKRYPGGLYNGMIAPIETFAIRGAIWYQGEANAKTVESGTYYEKQLTALITTWRNRWKQNDDFPFYFVQLPNFRAPQENPVDHDAMWPVIRESFLNVHKKLKNAKMAVTIDIGEEKNIHPSNKAEAGRRLALQALQHTYKKPIVGCSPVYQSYKVDGNKVILTFDSIGSGLIARNGYLKGFAIAGADRQFVWATATIKGNTVIVSSDKIKTPTAVRYAWANNPVGCNLYNKEGLPASPFRTDGR